MKHCGIKILAALLLLAGPLAGQAAAQGSIASAEDLFRNADPLEKVNPSREIGVSGVQIPQEMPEEAVFALDTPIDPASYVLGPGDVLGVSMRGSSGMYFQAMIAPDGSLLVPRLPVLHLGGLTLADALDTVAVRWMSEGGAVDVALLQMRRVRVSVGGPVAEPGTYVVSPADRAATLVELAGGLLEGKASPRRATLRLPDGTREPVDLLRYRRGGALDANPRLTGGAHLVVEPWSNHTPNLDVGGGVVAPGSFEYLPTDSLLDAIDLGGGLREDARLDSVVITSFDEAGRPAGRKVVNLAEVLDSGTRGPALAPGDLVYIVMRADWPERATVRIQGEVNYPGTYPVVVGETRLSDLVAMAGGFTDRAWLRGARIWSPFGVNDARHKEMARLDSLDALLYDDLETAYFEYYFRSLQRDFVAVDFEKAFHGTPEERSEHNLVFHQTRELVVDVPRPVHSVLVVGQVKNPGHYPYEEGLGYKDYLKMAGGTADGAISRWTRLVRYESQVWSKPGGGDPVYPGDMIFVPNAPAGTDWEMWSEVVRIVISAGTLATLIFRTFGQ